MALAGVGLVFLHTAGNSAHRDMAREKGRVALAGVGLVFLHTAGSSAHRSHGEGGGSSGSGWGGTGLPSYNR